MAILGEDNPAAFPYGPYPHFVLFIRLKVCCVQFNSVAGCAQGVWYDLGSKALINEEYERIRRLC